MGADIPPTAKSGISDAASTTKPPMVMQNPDGTITIQKEPSKEGTKMQKPKRDWSYPLRSLSP